MLSYATQKLRYVEPITTAQRHPQDGLPTNHNGTALPTQRPSHTSQRYSVTYPTPSPPIPMAQRHPHDALSTNPNGTALPIPPPPRKSQRHSATHRTPSPPIPTPQRHTRDTPTTNPHGTAHRTRHAHHQSPRHSVVTLPPNSPDASQSYGHSASGTPQSLANARSTIPKIETNTVPPPDPPSQKQGPFATHSGKRMLV